MPPSCRLHDRGRDQSRTLNHGSGGPLLHRIILAVVAAPVAAPFTTPELPNPQPQGPDPMDSRRETAETIEMPFVGRG